MARMYRLKAVYGAPGQGDRTIPFVLHEGDDWDEIRDVLEQERPLHFELRSVMAGQRSYTAAWLFTAALRGAVPEGFWSDPVPEPEPRPSVRREGAQSVDEIIGSAWDSAREVSGSSYTSGNSPAPKAKWQAGYEARGQSGQSFMVEAAGGATCQEAISTALTGLPQGIGSGILMVRLNPEYLATLGDWMRPEDVPESIKGKGL
jgi:hypothetical protein